ncbi:MULTISPECIES: tetratricopeptide repeat protein [Cryobacterium]|uniref:Tetratricopeptide repeat protein n=2 Tax=Cryobacterium TaxID=69578 RepID=A0ABY2IMX3_9MICO|nr:MULTISPECIES: tetratricopeptide repeat protein [Cryobacterium]MDY7527163.1 tetratricopeptide repeat protein [Cryobacterium sp. 10C2]MDY7557046.1 tetratricopeptide repeat protein [Cryobacterium sp. 10C3]MEB0002059.1 tetratricopeptide repeat protein [Cryobacterium sp. RTC2.1]MEB0286618.1 tetratricopeptide repeat protein [Cryobacterium sp. 10S3]MEB0290773.1 tetratricopeptide repeat protein [Cryobacterium sp. 10C2]
MKGRIGAGMMAILLAFYLVLVGWRAVLFLQSGAPVGIAIGVALLVLPLIGIWALVLEVTFGSRSARLVRLLEASGELPVETLPIRASGRPVRDAADADFPQYRDAVDAAPEDWKAWFRLGLAYDAAGDRKRARGAIRTAITLERAAA